MINAQYINLDMTPSGVLPVLYCSQYDIGRPLGMVVYNGGESVDLSTYTCTIEATRTDGTAITAAVTTDGNVGAFVTTATMTNKTDKYSAKLVIVDGGGNRVASLAFILCVTPATMDENAESIEEDASLYQQYTGTVQTIIAQIRTELSAEKNRAELAEATLQSNINAEATARVAAVTAEASARQSADTSLRGEIASEASTRATEDAGLQSQINQLVAPTGDAPSAAEVQNARIGADGKTYSTLGDAIRTQVTDLKDDLIGLNAYNLLNPLTHLNKTHNGITWSWDGDKCAVTGTATATENNDFFSSQNTMPAGFEPGATYNIEYLSTKINFNIYAYVNGTPNVLIATKYSGTFTIPSDATGMIIRLNIPQGDVVSEIIYPVITIHKSNQMLDYAIESTAYGKLNMADYEHGSITTGGVNNTYRQDARARHKRIMMYPFPVKISTTGGSYEVYTYSDDESTATGSGWQSSDYIIGANKKFRVVFTPTPTRSEYIFLGNILEMFTITPVSYGNENDGSWESREYVVTNVHQINALQNNSGDSGACFAEHNGAVEWWNFAIGSDDGTTAGAWYRRSFNADTLVASDSVITGSHDLGHVNSCAYNQARDAFICGSGSADATLEGKIFIIENAWGKTNLLRSDAVTIDFPISEYGIKPNVIWGDDGLIHYTYSNNVAWVITNDGYDVYRILLGMDDNVLENGSLIKTTGFNGTFKVLGHYTYLIGYALPDDRNVVQGAAYYNGRVYWGVGHHLGKCPVHWVRPRQGGGCDYAGINYTTYLDDGTMTDQSIQSISIFKNFLFCMFSNRYYVFTLPTDIVS